VSWKSSPLLLPKLLLLSSYLYLYSTIHIASNALYNSLSKSEDKCLQMFLKNRITVRQQNGCGKVIPNSKCRLTERTPRENSGQFWHCQQRQNRMCSTDSNMMLVGTPVVRVFRISTAILYGTCSRTGNHWSWRRSGLASERRFAASTTRAAVFCAHCSFFIVNSGDPCSSELQ